jgi:plasmid stability protein
MPNITVSDEVHERLRIRAHRSGRSMSHVANTLLARALDDEVFALEESASALDHVDAVTRKYGPEAGFQELLRQVGAQLNTEKVSL